MDFKGQFGRTWWLMGCKELRGQSQSCSPNFVPRRLGSKKVRGRDNKCIILICQFEGNKRLCKRRIASEEVENEHVYLQRRG